MSKRRRKSSRRTKGDIGPLGFVFDLAGALAMGCYVNNKVKKDYRNGSGRESAATAAVVMGAQARRRGSAGTIGLGGLMGLNSALKDIEREQAAQSASKGYYRPVAKAQTAAPKPHVEPGLWRKYCEDGSQYGLDPEDYETADDYEDALRAAKGEE